MPACGTRGPPLRPVPAPDEAVAEALLRHRRLRQCLSADDPIADFPADRAYSIQSLVVADRLSRGERRVGWKLGYTSAAMRAQMGIDDPNTGPLTDAMLLWDGARIPDTVIHPRVEPEVAVVMAADVQAPVPAEDLAPYVAAMRASLEVVDSVWEDYRFTWAMNTADGSSAAYAVLGATLEQGDLAGMAVSMTVNGALSGTGSPADAMGGPMSAVTWLAQELIGRGEQLKAGDVVLTGGLTRAVAILPGDTVAASFGSVTVSISR